MPRDYMINHFLKAVARARDTNPPPGWDEDKLDRNKGRTRKRSGEVLFDP